MQYGGPQYGAPQYGGPPPQQYGGPQYGGQYGGPPPSYGPPVGYQQGGYQQPAPAYAETAPPHSYAPAPLKDPDRRHSSGSGGAAEELTSPHRWRDLPWAILFWVQAIALLVVGWICYGRWKDRFAPPGDTDQDRDLGPLRHAIPLIGASIGVAAALAMLALYLCKNHGVTLIWASLIFSLICAAAVVVLAASAGDVVGVVICGLLFALTCWYIYSVRHKIPFAAAMLDVSLRAMGTWKSAWLLPIVGMILMSAVVYLWSICCFSIVYAVDNGSNESAYSVRGLIFFVLVLSFFWTTFTVKAWVHTCIAGVQATWYFLHPQSTPKHPVLGAVKRASTTSFGSIAFGAFITAFIRTVRFFVNQAYRNARNSNNQFAACALCCLECLIGILESIVQYINTYAFAIVAIYGKPFIPSAQQAWGLMRSRGYDAVINDSLIGGVLSLLIIVGGLSTGIFAALVAYYGYDTEWAPWAGVGFVIGSALMFVVSEIVESSVVSLFICLADDPVTLQRTKPEEYHRLTDPLNVHYPNRGRAQADNPV